MTDSRAWAVVDLDALRQNAAVLKRRAAASGASWCAVVKADGYGHGAVECARVAVEAGASRLAVATVAEADALGRVAVPVLVLGTLAAADEDPAIERGLELTVTDVDDVRRLGRASGRRERAIDVHVKIDTGLRRLGVRGVRGVRELVEEIARWPTLSVVGAYSHLATADDDRSVALLQLRELLAAVAPLRERWPAATLHLANSAATLRLPATHLEMVRTGIALYGVDPMGRDAAAEGLRPVLRLETRLATVRTLARGEGVGYGLTWRAPGRRRIATLPIGYADGVLRSLAGRGDVVIAGRRCPIAGAVSMDNITVDVTEAPEAVPGAAVTLIGDGMSVERVAAQAGTIPHEVLTRLGPRVKRIVIHDRSPTPRRAAGVA